MAQPALAEQAGETLEHQQSAVVVKAEGLGAQRVDAFACDRREMRQQRVGVDGIRIFLVAGEQEQTLAVQTGREVLPPSCTISWRLPRLWLAGRPPGSVAVLKPSCSSICPEPIPASRYWRCARRRYRPGGHRLRRQFHFSFNETSCLLKSAMRALACCS
nr:Uncharacterised protein [Klebsiella pneumoniae]